MRNPSLKRAEGDALAQHSRLVHGLSLQSDLPLRGTLPAPTPDVDFVVSTRPPGPRPSRPVGTVVAGLRVQDHWYEARRDGERLLIGFTGGLRFEVDPAAGHIAVNMAEPAEPELASLLLTGNVLALVLGVQGAPVLHASVVAREGAGIAVVAPSGGGKTTLAALLCAAGGALVTDDSARLEIAPDAVRVHRGPGELRLRTTMRQLEGLLAAPARETADGRLAVQPRASETPTAALDLLLFPQWSDAAARPSVAPVDRRLALESLLAAPRVTGWQVPEPQRAHFEAAGALAERLRAFSVVMPRLSERADDPAGALLEALADAGALPGVRR